MPAQAQTQNAKPIADWLAQFRADSEFKTFQVFRLNAERSDFQEVVSNAAVLMPDEDAVDMLLHTAPPTLHFVIPQADGSQLELELARVEILDPAFTVGVKGTDTQTTFPVHTSAHYRGIVLGDNASIACLSVTSTGISGMVANEEGTFQLGKLEDDSEQYIFYKTADLHAASPHSCMAAEESLTGDLDMPSGVDDRGVGCKTVTVYFECDYKLYTDKGSSVTNVTNYVTSLFNQIATLYANENVGIAISQIYVWTAPDPYINQSNISNVLNTFRQTLGTNFNGNLAHFLTTRSLGGGIAYVDVICFKQYAFGVSCIGATFQNVPTYSWSVEVVTHELGHNLGSWHTQSCNWPNGAIDNCVNPEGSCAPGPAPTNGGTIMSYCHLTGYGINFNNGFGQHPGAKIRDKVLNASCLASSGTPPAGLNATNITGVSATLAWNGVAGATSYAVQYKVSSSSSWTSGGTTTATILNLSNLSNNTAYQWQVKTDCSPFSATASFTTGSGGGGGSNCAAPGGLLVTNITSYSGTLTWTAVSGATQYTVQYKTSSAAIWQTAGSTGSTVYNLTGLNSGTSYQWKVKANCSAYSAVSTFVTSNSGGGGGGSCNPPAVLTNNQVNSTSASISWSAVSGASSYTIQLKLASSTTYFTLGTVPVTAITINGLQPSTSYHWRIKANCSFYSNSKLLTTLSNSPEQGTEQTFGEPSITYAAADLVEIYPNPAMDVVYLKQNFSDFVEGKVQLVNATGQVMFTENLSSGTLEIRVHDWPEGIYFLSVYQQGRSIATEKVVLMR